MRIRYPTENFRLRTQRIRSKTINALHLKRRTVNVLNGAGIRNVGQLSHWIDKGYAGILWGKSSVTGRDLTDALTALLHSTQVDGTVDWIKYAKERGLDILPSDDSGIWRGRNLIDGLIEVAEAAARGKFGDKGWIVLRSHLLTPGRFGSLARVGRALGLTREYVRIMAREISDTLRELVQNDDYCGLEFRLRPDFVPRIRALFAAVRTCKGPILTDSECKAMISETWQVGGAGFHRAEKLILELCGLHKMHFSTPKLKPIVFTSCFSPSFKMRFEAAANEVRRLLTREYPDGMTEAQLLAVLRAKLGRQCATQELLPGLLECLQIIDHRRPDARYRVRGRYLKDPSYHYERILREEGKPLHYREIARRAGRSGRQFALLDGPALTNRFIEDPRFVAVSQTGFWSLAEWRDVETRGIKDIAADILGRCKSPMHEDALYAAIAPYRQLAMPSLGTMLGRDHRFQKTAPRTWVLRKTNR
jgi:hypothetical protein